MAVPLMGAGAEGRERGSDQRECIISYVCFGGSRLRVAMTALSVRPAIGHPVHAHLRGGAGTGPDGADALCAGHRMRCMTLDDPWLGAVWPFVRGQLPPAPATVLEIGCGTVGGFVPALLNAGYDAVGVDPEAPEEPDYRRIEFERYEPPQPGGGVGGSLLLPYVAG